MTRRNLIAGTLLLGPAGIARSAEAAIPVAALDHVNIHVPDATRSAEFCTKLFGTVVSRTASALAKPDSARGEIWFLRMGDNMLANSTSGAGERPGVDHFCFAVAGFRQ